MNRLAESLVLILLSAAATGIMSIQASRSVQANVDSAPVDAVATVGSETINAAEFQAQLLVVRSNLAYMHAQIAEHSQNSAFLQAFIDLIDAHGVANVAFASLIEDRAIYLLAIERGFAPSEVVVTATIQHDKSLVSNGSVKLSEADNAYIDNVGRENYWTTMFPMIVKRQLATQALFESVTNNATTSSGQTAAWQLVEKHAVDTVSVTVLDPLVISPASARGAISYVNDYWAFRARWSSP